jgi:hypothetical protein
MGVHAKMRPPRTAGRRAPWGSSTRPCRSHAEPINQIVAALSR